jgi:hypothetical protein
MPRCTRLDFSATDADTNCMSRIALTVWFTFSTLLGPGVCCCSLGLIGKSNTVSANDLSSKPAKSCCGDNLPPCNGDHGQKHDPANPSKCPCKHGKQFTDAAPSSGFDAKAALSEFRVADTLFVGSTPSLFDDLTQVASSKACVRNENARTSQRTLFALGSLLRC